MSRRGIPGFASRKRKIEEISHDFGDQIDRRTNVCYAKETSVSIAGASWSKIALQQLPQPLPATEVGESEPASKTFSSTTKTLPVNTPEDQSSTTKEKGPSQVSHNTYHNDFKNTIIDSAPVPYRRLKLLRNSPPFYLSC
jgi:hypothetical protein